MPPQMLLSPREPHQPFPVIELGFMPLWGEITACQSSFLKEGSQGPTGPYSKTQISHFGDIPPGKLQNRGEKKAVIVCDRNFILLGR